VTLKVRHFDEEGSWDAKGYHGGKKMSFNDHASGQNDNDNLAEAHVEEGRQEKKGNKQD